MLLTTPAIVLSLQPYSDKAHILHTYTRSHGRVNLLVYGVGKKKSAAVYAPFSLVEITFDYQPARTLPSLRQCRLLYIPQQTLFDPCRQAVALFLAEVLYRTLRHPMEDADLFAYLATVVPELDTTPEPQHLHLRFLFSLAAYLGFAIDPEQQPELLTIPASRTARQSQLNALCAYFAAHIDDWQPPRSLPILMELFD